MDALRQAVQTALTYCKTSGIEVPPDLRAKAMAHGFLKASGDLSSINATYHDAITTELTTYFEGGIVTGPRNRFRVATTEAFYDAFYLGYSDGGGDTPDTEALDWLTARINQEYGFIDMLFVQIKELRKDTEFDFFAFVTARADGYTNTLREIYNAAYARASADVMVTFDGDDGAESCETCQQLKGQRHRLSWFVKRNYLPPFGTGLQCHPGGHCKHYLRKDNGEIITA